MRSRRSSQTVPSASRSPTDSTRSTTCTHACRVTAVCECWSPTPGSQPVPPRARAPPSPALSRCPPGPRHSPHTRYLPRASGRLLCRPAPRAGFSAARRDGAQRYMQRRIRAGGPICEYAGGTRIYAVHAHICICGVYAQGHVWAHEDTRARSGQQYEGICLPSFTGHERAAPLKRRSGTRSGRSRPCIPPRSERERERERGEEEEGERFSRISRE